MLNQKPPRVLILLHFIFIYSYFPSSLGQNITFVGVGVVGDLNSPLGRMMTSCMDMAISDFYSANTHYQTRLQLRQKDVKTVLDFNLAVLESAKQNQVVGILGPQGSSDEAFAAAVGESVHVPIVSLTARSSNILYEDNNYFVRTTLDDAVQAEALAALCQRYKWTEAVVLHEDSGYGNLFLSHLIKSFQDVDIGLARMVSIPTAAEDGIISEELNKLKVIQTKVFLVHLNPTLGYRLFEIAQNVGMMSEGYAWIVTDSLSIFLQDSDQYPPNGSMDGVLGIRPYPFPSKNLETFQQRWRRQMLENNITSPIMKLNVYGLWAYDAVTALALSAEESRLLNSSSLQANTTTSAGLLGKLGSVKFRGLAGDFHLAEGKLEPSAYEIFYIIGTGEKRVGFWTPQEGIVQELSTSSDPTSKKELKTIMWPGDSVFPPVGWRIPGNGSLRVGIPWKPGFKEFVDAKVEPVTNKTTATGFVIDIFLASLKVLPFPISYEFICYNDSNNKNWSYDDMLHRIPKEYDMVVADTTLWAPRAAYVDFSLPYSESGVVLVVKNKKPVDMWIFIKPLSWDLWLAIVISCIFIGIALHILERRMINTDADSVSPRVPRPGPIYWSPIAILAFPERNIVSNNWSVFILVCWLFTAFILMQSFTASLSAILTVDQLKFEFSGDYYVGYHEGSFLKKFLIKQLSIKESKLKPYSSTAGFHEAMSKGSKHGGIDVIFDEYPYMKLFLNRYESQYKMVGPTYRTDGLGFAFPPGSPLAAHFSRAILNVTQGPEMNHFEQKNFGPGYSSQDPLSSVISQGTSSLTLREFAGLFLIVGSLTVLALFCSETPIGRKITGAVQHFVQNGCTCGNPQVHSVVETAAPGNSNTAAAAPGNSDTDANHGGGDSNQERQTPGRPPIRDDSLGIAHQVVPWMPVHAADGSVARSRRRRVPASF